MKNYFQTKSKKFKNNMFNVTISLNLDKNITALNLLCGILKQGTMKYKTSKEISNCLQELYGATFDIYISVKGTVVFFNVYMKSLNDRFAIGNENITERALEFVEEVIFNPLILDGEFDKNVFANEVQNLRDFIESRTDDKDSYLSERIEEISFKGEQCEMHKYGEVKVLDKLENREVVEVYKNLILNGKKCVFAVGDVDEKILSDFSKKLNSEEFVPIEPEKLAIPYASIISDSEKLQVTQGKLGISYETDISIFTGDSYAAMVMNSIFGEGASSKLFRVIREEKSLCYGIYSHRDSYKGLMYVTAGIDLDKFDLVISLVDDEIDNMRKGIFSDKDIELAIEKLITDYKSIEDSIHGLVGFMIGRAMFGMNYTVDNIIEEIKQVNRERIIEVSKKIKKRAIFKIDSEV